MDCRRQWDTRLKLGRKVQLVEEAGWVTKTGKLSKRGEAIAESRWADLSPAAQNVLRRSIGEFYQAETISEPTPSQSLVQEPWQMTLLAFGKSKLPQTQRAQITEARQVKSFYPQHKKEVQAALERGENVPLEVLREFKGEAWADAAWETGALTEKPKAATLTEKEPWQMTYVAVREELGRLETGTADQWRRSPVVQQLFPEGSVGRVDYTALSRLHKASIGAALSEGKPVPSSVLADYPDLRELKQAPSEVVTDEPVPTTMSELRTVHESRSLHAQRVDEARTSQKVVSPRRAERWARNPSRFDVPGVDAPKGTKVTVKHKKRKRTSGRPSGIQRMR